MVSHFNSPLPVFLLKNRQRSVKINLKVIRKLLLIAFPYCLEKKISKNFILPNTIEITFISNRSISRVHQFFFQDPAPTDVITFLYGEILVGIQVVEENSKKFSTSIQNEIILCIVHGILHLFGYQDDRKEDQKIMYQYQFEILQKVCDEYLNP